MNKSCKNIKTEGFSHSTPKNCIYNYYWNTHRQLNAYKTPQQCVRIW